MNQIRQFPQLNFTREEFASRLHKTQTAMQSAGLNTLVVVDPSRETLNNSLSGCEIGSLVV